MNDIVTYTNEIFGTLRVLDIDNQPWFIGKEVAEKLGYINTRDALKTHVDKEDKADVVIHDGRQNRKMVRINESGLYSLILGSNLPNAKKFKRWVTSEVLPNLRQKGYYALKDGEGIAFTYGEVAKEINKLCKPHITASDITDYLLDEGYFTHVVFYKNNGIEREAYPHKQPTEKFINEVVKEGYAMTKKPDKRGKILHKPKDGFTDWFCDNHLSKFIDRVDNIRGQLSFNI